MLWSLILHLVLIILVIHICASSFKYVRVSFFHHYLIPVYSLIMFLITMTWTRQDLILLAILTVVAVLLGLLETAGLKFEKEPSKKAKSGWTYRMYRGWPYVICWALVILIGLALSDLISHAGFVHLFTDKVFETIVEEINPLSLFTQEHPWYIWLLSAVSSLTFIVRGTRMLKEQGKEGRIRIITKEERKQQKAEEDENQNEAD